MGGFPCVKIGQCPVGWARVSYACGRRASRGGRCDGQGEARCLGLGRQDPGGLDRAAVNARAHRSPLQPPAVAAPVYLEDVNDRGVVMLVTRHRDQNQFSRYFYPWGVVGWIRLAEEDEQE